MLICLFCLISAEPKAFSWAALAASSGNKKSGSAPPPPMQTTTSPQAFGKGPSVSQAYPKPDTKQETSPQPQRAPRYVFTYTV